MTKYDFETIIDRRGTGCLKWDAWSRRGHAPDDLPLWVADMDFKTAPAAIEALTERVQHGVFGYTMATDGYCEAVQSWFERRHGWRPAREWFVMTPGVVFALAMAREHTLTVPFLYGLGLLPMAGWVSGTLFGALAGSILPLSIRTALGVMLYGMFIAIIIPPAKKERPVALAALLALILSSLFAWVPALQKAPKGTPIVICTVAAAALCAWLFPVEEEK